MSKSVKPDSIEDRWCVGNRTLAIAAAFLFALGLGLTIARIVIDYQTPGPFTPDRQGLCDFHNGIYFPARAAIAGESPYSVDYAAKYPVARQIPFFSPVILWLHAPLALLPLHVGETLNLILQIGVLFGIAIVCAGAAGFRKRMDVILVIASVLVFTRGGHVTLFTGYFTLQLVLATLLAVAWADRRPIASAWMLLIVSAKPTYILPLGFLMLARGNFRALAIGASFSIAGAAASLGWIAYYEGGGDITRGASVVRDQIIQTQEVHRSMEDESPLHSWTRLDLFAILSKWTGSDPGDLPHLAFMFLVLAMPMAILWQQRNRLHDDGIAGLTGALLMTAMLVSLYHQSYDSLLLTAPLVGLIASLVRAGSNPWQHVDQRVRGALVILMMCPAVNYFSTRSFLIRFEISEFGSRLATSINGVSLSIALVLLVWIAWSAKETSDDS